MAPADVGAVAPADVPCRQELGLTFLIIVSVAPAVVVVLSPGKPLTAFTPVVVDVRDPAALVPLSFLSLSPSLKIDVLVKLNVPLLFPSPRWWESTIP